MTPSPHRPAVSRGRRACRLAFVVLLLTAWPVAAQSSTAASATGVQLTPQTQQLLKELSNQWLQWDTAYLQDEPGRSAAQIDEMLATAGAIGFASLPDFAYAALARAKQAAAGGDFERSRWVIEAAERMAPGSPEVAFASADTAWQEGAYHRVLPAYFKGLARQLATPSGRWTRSVDLGLWALYVLLAAGGLFIVLETATKGGGLYRDLVRLLAHPLPLVLAHAVAIVLLMWPLVLPYGALWLILYWSLLEWGHGSPSERVVLVAVWVLIGLAPFLLHAGRERVALELSPPVKAMESLRRSELYGALFSDLGALTTLLPGDPTVQLLVADLHRRLGQWDIARNRYEQLIEDGNESSDVLLSLGAYYFYKGDYGTAIDSFRRAAELAPSAAAFYNLSQAYSEGYYFAESRQALGQAQELDETRVSRWLASDAQRVVTPDGGLAGVGQLRRRLDATGESEPGGGLEIETLRRGVSLLLTLGLVLAAFTLHLARRPFGYSEPMIDLDRGLPERIGRALVPGLRSAEVGEGGRAFAALLMPVALVLLPLGGRFVFALPMGYDPGTAVPWAVAGLGLGVLAAVRLAVELRGR